MKFKNYFTEGINNLFTKDKKQEVVDIVWDLLQKSYAPIGGIKGSGFNSKEDMYNIPFWKTVTVNNKIVAGIMYKDKDFRKTVAVFTDGTKVGKIN